jgi:hypothetical protein
MSKIRRTRRRPATKPHTRRRLAPRVAPADAEIESLRQELQRATSRVGPPRWNASPDDVQRSVIQLVLTLVEFIRKLMERQAVRRLEARTLTKKETENVGLALMRLEETIRDIAEQFNLRPEDLNLDLGPVGKLM